MSKIVKFILPLMLFIVIGFSHYTDNPIVSFEPFFKKNDSSGIIPPFPTLTDFDNEILRICGNWGSQPDEKDFRILLDDPQYQTIVQRIYNALDHQVITPNADLELFKDELIHIWFTNSGIEKETVGFTHIFCGQPDKHGLGGMHFVGRYVEAQKNKWAGAIWDNRFICSKTDIKPPVYTLGIQYLDPADGEIKVKCPGGYAYNLHADDILIFASTAFKELGKDGMCLYKIENDNYESLFIRHNGAILTFYPDLTPHGSCTCTH
ncbi:hypothetical protein BIY23_01225 [Wolbachia pipientis]|uniref:Bacterial EndoU nuclease domain-containing protein n=1 Tax=Wolbachia pipientis TaxID=955 RepID=A0A1E7QKT6_WOLPI|nr:EndoU domain-containing protein [Wolbachia pipientis]OEY87091.1 hypothetical protein BIY23_01225 [Wolbachia pipientis]